MNLLTHSHAHIYKSIHTHVNKYLQNEQNFIKKKMPEPKNKLLAVKGDNVIIYIVFFPLFA